MADDSPTYGDLEAIIDQVYGEEASPADETAPGEGDEIAAEDQEADEATEAGQPDEAPAEETDDADNDELAEEAPEEEADDTDEPEDEGVEPESSDLLDQLVTVKVNGEEMQVTVAQAVKNYQLAAAANARFEEAAKIRDDAREAVEFQQSFNNLWDSNPGDLVGYLVAQATDPNALVEAAILRAASLGKLDPQVAEALGLTDDVRQQLTLKYEREQLAQERASLAQEREASTASENAPDEYGYTADDYRAAFTEMLNVAELSDATEDEQRTFIEAVLDHGDAKGIHNPYLAFASYREAEVRRQLERTERAAKAVSKVTKETKTAAALAPKGRVQHAPTRPQIDTPADAAEWALAEIEKKYGAL